MHHSKILKHSRPKNALSLANQIYSRHFQNTLQEQEEEGWGFLAEEPQFLWKMVISRGTDIRKASEYSSSSVHAGNNQKASYSRAERPGSKKDPCIKVWRCEEATPTRELCIGLIVRIVNWIRWAQEKCRRRKRTKNNLSHNSSILDLLVVLKRSYPGPNNCILYRLLVMCIIT